MSEKAVFESDICLTGRVAAGDREAERALVHRVMARVHDTCDYLVRGPDAQDIAQQALVQVVRSAGSFRGESSLEYWVDRVTLHTAAKSFEKAARRRKLWESVFMPDAESVDVEHQVGLGQVRERLRHHFAAISEKQRMVVALHYLYDYEIPEIADLIDAKINAVRSRLRKGLKRLRKDILRDPGLRDWIREGQK